MRSPDEAQNPPLLTDAQIEAAAEQLLSDFDGWAQEITRPVPVEVIAEHFLGYELVVSEDGVFADRDCLGGIAFEDETITINRSIEGDLGRYSFTVAHEIGHHVLHKEFYFDHLKKNTAKIICREVSSKPVIERQADRFAAALLMPSKIVASAVSSISKGSRPFEKPTTAELRTLAAKVVAISGVTNVSNTAMVNRLIDLGLVSGAKYQTGRPQDFYREVRDIGFNMRTIKWVFSSLKYPRRLLRKLRKSK